MYLVVWTEMAVPPTAFSARTGHASVYYNQTGTPVIYTAGGFNPVGTSLSDLWMYNIVTGKVF